MSTKAAIKQERGGIFAALFHGQRLGIAAALLLAAPLANAGEMARSADGKWLAIANAQPHVLTIISTETNTVTRRFEIAGRNGTLSEIEGVYTDPTRRNFIVTLRDFPEFWLISTDPNAPPVFEGFVHNNENGMTEGLASSEGLFALKKFQLDAIIGDLVFSPDYRTATGLRPDKRTAVDINLNVNREISEYALPFPAHP